MNIKKVAASIACAVGMAGAVSAATLDNVSANVVPGEWTSSFAAAKSYAEKNSIPMLLFWSNNGCGQCNKLKTACNKADFVAWRKDRKLIFVFSENDPTSKSFAVNPSKKFPYMRLYWPAGGVDLKFSGRASTIPASGATLQAQLMNCVDARIQSWINGNFDPGSGTIITPDTPTPSVPTPGPEWNKARMLYGSYYTSDGLVAGRIALKAAKVNKKGTAKIKVTVTDVSGKSKASSQKAFTVDATTKGTISASFGTYEFSITGAAISGRLIIDGETFEVKPVAPGGAIADGTLAFNLLSYPENCQGSEVIEGTKYLPMPQMFTTKSARWSFDRKGTLKYDRKSGEFVMSSLANPSGLKLSYSSATGFFKGTFTVYAKRTATMAKRYSATVTGYMVGGSGAGVAIIRGVGVYDCTIKDSAAVAEGNQGDEQ